MMEQLAKSRGAICGFFAARGMTNFCRVLFFKLGGAKTTGKVYLNRGNLFTDLKKVEIRENSIIGRNNIFCPAAG